MDIRDLAPRRKFDPQSVTVPEAPVAVRNGSDGIKQQAIASLHNKIGARLADPNLSETDLNQLVRETLNVVMGELPFTLTEAERGRLVEDVIDDALKLGPLEDMLRDTSITEIMVNGCDAVFVERNGKVVASDLHFESNDALRRVIERIVTRIGRRIDESSPMVDARLADGSRVNAVLTGVSADGPSLTIRKFPAKPLTINDLIAKGSLDHRLARFLEGCVQGRLNILVSGGTGSGKTTLLNILSNFIPDSERVVSIEDALELQLHQQNLVRLEARPANTEGKGAITIRDLVANSLRMRPDRIIVGECRGGEALDMLQAMNTGHDGSLSTVHANDPRAALQRLETLVLMAGADLPSRAIREQIESAIHVVVQTARMKDGSRKVTSVAEITGIVDGTVQTSELYNFNHLGFSTSGRLLGNTEPTGAKPTFLEMLAEHGVIMGADLFTKPVVKAAA